MRAISATSPLVGKRLPAIIRPSLLVALLYIAFLIAITAIHHYDILSYVHIGSRFTMHDPRRPPGYDGQFFYQIARDPLHATPFLDKPPYRYQRITYALLVFLLSGGGQPALVPYMLLLVNLVSIVFSVEVVAHLLERRSLSPWFSLALGLYFGQGAALIFDTCEPFTYALICLGLLLLEYECVTWAAISMGLAALSRDIALFFPIAYTLYFLLHRRWGDAARFVSLGIVPLFAWYGIIWIIFGQTGVKYAPPFEHVPFGGLFYWISESYIFRQLFIAMFLPTAVGWFLAIIAMVRRQWSIVLLILVMHLLLVTFMAPDSYRELISCGRLSTGLVLAMLLYGLQTKNKAVLWFAQYYTLMFPFYVYLVMISTFAPT